MSLQFDLVPVKDSRLLVKGNDLAFAVQSGGSSINATTFPANSSSTSQITFTINVPSLTTGLSRRIVFSSKVRFSLTGIPSNGAYLWDASTANGALAAMPLQGGLVSTMSIQLNNTTVSLATSDIMSAFLRQLSKEQTLGINGTVPCIPDNCRSYADFTNATNNVLAGFNSSSLNDEYIGRGSYPVTVISNPVGDGVNSRTTVLEVDLREVCIVSPFQFDAHGASSALFGLNNVQITLNLNSSPVNFWKSNGTQLASGGLAVNVVSYTNPVVLCEFISPQSTDLARMPSICSTPYLGVARYVTGSFTALSAGQTGVQLQSANLQLNGIPDLMAVFVRRSVSTQSATTADAFLSIRNISLSWGNRSGLLASYTPDMLFAMSKRNGNVGQNYLEFDGKANLTTATFTGGNVKALTGSLLLIQPVIDFGVEPYESNSSYGQYNLQFTVTVDNYGADSFTPEIVLVTYSSGIFQSQSGSSALFENILSKAQVLEAAEKEPITTLEYGRMLGSGIMDKLKSAAMYVHRRLLPKAKELLATSSHPYAQKGKQVLESLGYGKKKDSRLM